MPDAYAKPMKMLVKPVLHACLGALLLAGGASAQPSEHSRQDSNGRLAKRQAGTPERSVREIERVVVPTLPGAQYLGFDYDPTSNVYTLKFLRNGSVIWVDVDGRTGRILRRTGD